MNPKLQKLQSYPFERLRRLFADANPPNNINGISLSIGEPKHLPPTFVTECLNENIAKIANYPTTKGIPELRSAISEWASQRFSLADNTLCADQHVLPVNGTREALFSFVQAVFDERKQGKKVLMPNPFYQIYEGAAYLAGAEPYFLNCDEENGFIPDLDGIDGQIWDDCQLLIICSPGNPTGAVMHTDTLKKLIKLADKHDFIIASDECYSELYFDEASPPAGLLQACSELGRHSYERCIVFHSLSKRSNLPGLRSGFVAGDASIIEQYLLYRTYHGCAMPVYAQLASTKAWQDEAHVVENRQRYREKFDAVANILQKDLAFTIPEAGFYLWPKTDICDQAFAQGLYDTQHVSVLPGSFLARDTATANPGKQRIRMALVAPLSECVDAAQRIKKFAHTQS